MYKYQPKRPVKSFQDLSVYQKTYSLAILITKHLTSSHSTPLNSGHSEPREESRHSHAASLRASLDPSPEFRMTGVESKMTEVESRMTGVKDSVEMTSTKDLLDITKNLTSTALSIPRLIATAHSLRFGDPVRAIADLEQAMLNCNLAIHYLSLVRDLSNNCHSRAGGNLYKSNRSRVKPGMTKKEVADIDNLDFDQTTKDYHLVRRQIMRLQRSWQKFMQIKKLNQK